MFRTIIPLSRDNEVDEPLNLVLKTIKKDNGITKNQLVEKTGLSLATIKRSTDYLRKNGYIERVGSKKSGHWKIL